MEYSRCQFWSQEYALNGVWVPRFVIEWGIWWIINPDPHKPPLLKIGLYRLKVLCGWTVYIVSLWGENIFWHKIDLINTWFYENSYTCSFLSVLLLIDRNKLGIHQIMLTTLSNVQRNSPPSTWEEIMNNVLPHYFSVLKLVFMNA